LKINFGLQLSWYSWQNLGKIFKGKKKKKNQDLKFLNIRVISRNDILVIIYGIFYILINTFPIYLK
nr:hypothetical protein [Escherichia coli]